MRAPILGSASDRPSAELDVLPSAVDDTRSWFDAIQAATNRVTALTTGRADPSRAGNGTAGKRPHAVPAPQRSELSAVLELMQRERFTEALALLEALPAAASDHPDALLLSAVLLTNDGRIGEAEQACEKLLATDELNAGAHYLKALCREHAGDTLGAAEHDQLAVHLDPSFAMPHLHAGLLAKRSGDSLSSRRELGQALTLLEREETSRLVLFGGGFSREALTLLCRTELAKPRGKRLMVALTVEALRREFDASFALPPRERPHPDTEDLLGDCRGGPMPYALRIAEIGAVATAAPARHAQFPRSTWRCSGLVGLRGTLDRGVRPRAPARRAERGGGATLARPQSGGDNPLGRSRSTPSKGHLRLVPSSALRRQRARRGLVEHVVRERRKRSTADRRYPHAWWSRFWNARVATDRESQIETKGGSWKFGLRLGFGYALAAFSRCCSWPFSAIARRST